MVAHQIENSFTIWKSKIPFKIKIFLWLVKHKKVLTKVTMSNRGWNGDTACGCCGLPESTDHLFVECPLVRTIWIWIANYNNFQFILTCVD